MGNEHSQMSGLNVEEKAIEVTDFWSHHSATLNTGNSNVSTVSVFIGEPLVGGSLWMTQTPLEKASKVSFHIHNLNYITSMKLNYFCDFLKELNAASPSLYSKICELME